MPRLERLLTLHWLTLALGISNLILGCAILWSLYA